MGPIRKPLVDEGKVLLHCGRIDPHAAPSTGGATPPSCQSPTRPMTMKARDESRKLHRRLPRRVWLLVLMLSVLPLPANAQTASEPLDLIYRGEFDELGWEYSDLLHVAVVITSAAKAGCQLEEGVDLDVGAYVSAWTDLLGEYPDLGLLNPGYAFHPTAQRLPVWMAEMGAAGTSCSHPLSQQLLLNTARYVIAYEGNQPTEAEVVEAQKDAWWAKLEMVRAAEEMARWHIAGWVNHRVGTDLALENRDEVLKPLAESLASLPPEQLQQCQGIRLRVLLDEEGRVMDVFERHEASGYSSYNSDSRSQRSWERSRDGCRQQLPIAKDAARSMQFQPARTPEGLDVPIWLDLLVDIHPRLEPLGVTLQTHTWAWRLRDGDILAGSPWRLKPHRFDPGHRPPRSTAVVRNEPQDAAASAERVEQLKAQGPGLTPFTVAPAITNPDVVREAIERYYPPTLRGQGMGGSVPVWILVDTNGAVADVRLVQGSGQDDSEGSQVPPGFERNPVENLPPPGGSESEPLEPQDPLQSAALKVAAVMEFSPARNRNMPVAVWIQKPVTFDP